MNKLKLVLDSSALIGGFLPEEDEYYTVSDVIDEVEDCQSKERLSYFLNSGKIKIKEPKKEIVDEVIKKTQKTGDQLSLTDIKIIALAVELDSPIISEDYGIQNVSSLINVKYKSIREPGIKKIINWEYYCMGCRKIYSNTRKTCQDCGSIIKRRPKK
ncbi:MAG: Endoribonuclease Nob1 [Candidatus Methanofastidiosum methylothiophilum]|uniref:Endoribonuclease Nob1 n=1 Tax=Candidatus Methanofastidiosum methylothiophilum TaxID=1705564 RepID=A0A150IS17_9EURY|nr:MAG: Endoribonuclease Nob1 [Candidatus Methanofastidiosum methylthiophilus]KYC47777.1 MAG: Endoribonuclease Nob1 [Candidatus Methanofastidiosum methylthiophilus]KYC49405.1 MAG: Endoribonuclease Nob1 [Candidatus Methanofastidiosum methylthiophilus]